MNGEKIKPNKGKIRDQYSVVLEDINGKLKGVSEGVTMANEKMDREFKKIDEKFEKVDENFRLIRAEISLIRHNQVTRDEFRALEDRVFTIEKKISK